jgi:hypothetical protein
MQTASLEDEELLKENLKGLNGVSNVSLIEIRDQITASVREYEVALHRFTDYVARTHRIIGRTNSIRHRQFQRP